MKNIFNNRSLFFGLLIALIALTGCNEQSGLGLEILPKDDIITVKNVVVKEEISAFTFLDDSVRTDESSRSLLGELNDPVFGQSVINYAAQFRLQSFPEFGVNAVSDSVKLIIRYRQVYGDTVTPQVFRVYEMESPLDVDQEYYQGIDLKSMAYDQMLGETTHTPAIMMDSTETQIFQQIFSIQLDNSLGDKIVNADSTDLSNNDNFLELFKGLYVETEALDPDGGAIIGLDEISNSNYLGSGMVIYYHNDEVGPDSLFLPILITEFSARVNQMIHDYSGTAFEENMDSEEVEDSLIYVQATGGLKSRILIDNLDSWKDSVNTAINKAELIFQVDTLASDIANFAPPSQLLFTIVDEDGVEFLPIDYVFNPNYYGGGLEEDYTYRFNITQHLQEIIEGSVDNYGFYLTPANKNNEANRVVLKGSQSAVGIKLVITYSKFTI